MYFLNSNRKKANIKRQSSSDSSCSFAKSCPTATPWIAAHQASLSFTVSQVLKLMYTELAIPSIHLILCCPLLLLPSIFPSIRIFPHQSALGNRWPKYWSFSLSPSNVCSWLISFRIDWFDLLVVWGTVKSFLQQHISKASVLWQSAFFMVQLSHLYMITRKTIALTIQTFVGKVMSPLFNTLPSFVIAFLPWSKRLLILWFCSHCPSDFWVQENKICHSFHFFPIYLPWSDGTGSHDLSFLNVEF